jgi:diaminopimelate epimerase
VLPFVKTQALGNDFLLVEQARVTEGDYPSLARRICDRRLGLGADGLILWTPGAAAFQLRIFNIDGSEAECSGNGLRCAAAYLLQSGKTGDSRIELQTVSGIYVLEKTGDRFAADMGIPALSPKDIPFVTPEPLERVVDFTLEVEGEPVRITACSTGNPHCSLFVDAIDSTVVETLGPKLETHPAFPNKTNVEFIHVRNPKAIEVAFWERGAGRTPSSGTGSCGATVASILNQRTERTVTVHTQYGTLEVEWNADSNRLRLVATASVVAEGEYRGA